jgi:DNA-binding HxlR family transcriptional regulator
VNIAEAHPLDDRRTEQPNVALMVESVLRCKWSWQVLGQIRSGVSRPGAMKRALPGLTTKVQNDCLQRMLFFGIIERTSFPEIPPRVEYTLTSLGGKFSAILDSIHRLQGELIAEVQSPAA